MLNDVLYPKFEAESIMIYAISVDDLQPNRNYIYKAITPTRVYTALVLAPVIETFIFYQIPLYLVKRFNFNKTFFAHLIGAVFSLVHIINRDSLIYIWVYFGAVMWAWAWLIIEKWPPEERVLNPFMSITLMHATLNGLVLAITPLLRWIG